MQSSFRAPCKANNTPDPTRQSYAAPIATTHATTHPMGTSSAQRINMASPDWSKGSSNPAATRPTTHPCSTGRSASPSESQSRSHRARRTQSGGSKAYPPSGPPLSAASRPTRSATPTRGQIHSSSAANRTCPYRTRTGPSLPAATPVSVGTQKWQSKSTPPAPADSSPSESSPKRSRHTNNPAPPVSPAYAHSSAGK